MNKNKIFTIIALVAIACLGMGLRLYNISYPAKPVWDEAHFATYAADYAKGQAFFDIHPPLGKLIFAAAISLSGAKLGNTDFVTIKINKKTNHFDLIDNDLAYGNYPYIALRAVSALFGVLLALAFYWFMRSLGAGNIGALLGALAITLENALLLQTRLIFLDGMYLAFGFAALALYFRSEKNPMIAGAVWGLSLSVKLTGIVFAGPVLVHYLLSLINKTDNAKNRPLKLAIAGFAVLFIISLADPIIFSANQRIAALGQVGLTYKLAVTSDLSSKLLASVAAYVEGFSLATSNYIAGPARHEAQSPWYFWPAMQIPMHYFTEIRDGKLKEMILEGNPVVWYLSTLAVIFAIALTPRYFKKYLKEGKDQHIPVFLLLSGFLSSIAPYFMFVRRVTSIYHYFPALVFAIGLLAWFVAKIFKLEDFDSLSRGSVAILVLSVAAMAGGFLLAARVTYGL